MSCVICHRNGCIGSFHSINEQIDHDTFLETCPEDKSYKAFENWRADLLKRREKEENDGNPSSTKMAHLQQST